MARVAGVNIPTSKRVPIALTYIHGIGLHSSKKICKKFNPVILDKTKKSVVIQVTALRAEIDKLALDLKSLGLISTSRTGAVAMTKGSKIFS